MEADKDTAQTIVAVYNRYLIDAMLAFKTRPTVRNHIRDGGHKAVDPCSPCHLEHAASQLRSASDLRMAFVRDISPADVLQDARSLAFEPLKGVPLSVFVCQSDGELSEADAQVLKAYVFVLVTLAATHSDACEVLSRQVIAALSRAQSCTDTAADGILDDEIVALLNKVAACSSFHHENADDDDDDDDEDGAEDEHSEEANDSKGGEGVDPLEGVMKMLENSKIASMASEISGDIQLDPNTDPADLISFDKLADGNSPLGKIVSQVGSKIKSKLDSGELKQDELLKEAVGFLKAFEGMSDKIGSGGKGGTSALMNSVMKMAGGLGGAAAGRKGGGMASALSMLSGLGGGHGRLSSEQRRERLRRKLAKQT